MYDPQTEASGDTTCDWPMDDDEGQPCLAYATWHSFPGSPQWVECEDGHRYTVTGTDDGQPVIAELAETPAPSGYGRPAPDTSAPDFGPEPF